MFDVEQFETAEATAEFLSELKSLVFGAFGNSFSEDDWNHGLGGRHFVVIEDASLVACCTVVPRTLYINEKPISCGYLEGVATAPHKRLQGFAAAAVQAANRYIVSNFEIGGLSTSKNGFYSKFGWRTWQGPSFVLSNGSWRSTDSEQGGIMVLFSDTADQIDLNSRIACEERSGDDW